MTACRKQDGRKDYAAPLLSNGELSLTLDYSGVQTGESVPVSTKERRVHYPLPGIFLEGRRYGGNLEENGQLIPFGFLSQKGVGAIVDWEQALCWETVSTRTKTRFDSGLEIETEAFVLLNANVLAIKKRFSEECGYTLIYHLAPPEHPERFPEGMTAAAEADGGLKIRYEAEGRMKFSGAVRFLCSDPGFAPAAQQNRYSFTGRAEKGAEVCFYLVFSDTLTETVPDSPGWEELYRKNCELAAEFRSEGYAETGDEAIDRTYQVASYDLRCVSTPWGIPVGIFPSHWQGGYFTFDEFYMLDALLSSHHLKNAKKAVDFRAGTLNVALQRAADMERFPERMQARYPWVANEEGGEMDRPGFYNDHIFHMANAAIGAWEYFLHSGDEAALRGSLYPVIKACAGFYHCNMIYRLETGTIIGSCTDLERLGPSVRNAYMTTCSAVALLRIFADAADLLGADTELAAQCRAEADELFQNLPNDGSKYLACPGSQDASVAVMTGTYPYGIHESRHPWEDRAVADYIGRESSFGNMYAMGKQICSWYSLWKAMYYIRRLDRPNAAAAVRQSMEECGAFGEMFEINEEAVSLRPWFATASAFFVTAVNEMLLQNRRDGTILLLPCLPDELGSVRFKLSAHGHTTVELEMKEFRIERLGLSGNTGERRIGIPDRYRYDGAVLSREDGINYYSCR